MLFVENQSRGESEDQRQNPTFFHIGLLKKTQETGTHFCPGQLRPPMENGMNAFFMSAVSLNHLSGLNSVNYHGAREHFLSFISHKLST